MTKVYLDMDGVLADFDGGLLKGYGIKNCIGNYGTPWEKKSSEQRKIAEDIRVCMATPGFFENLPMVEGAEKLWEASGQPYILTAVPGQGCDEMVAREKRNWVDRVLGQLPEGRLITCHRPEKAKYAIAWEHGSSFPIENILVDDSPQNVLEWKNAGGIGILFETVDQAVNDLKKAINER